MSLEDLAVRPIASALRGCPEALWNIFEVQRIGEHGQVFLDTAALEPLEGDQKRSRLVESAIADVPDNSTEVQATPVAVRECPVHGLDMTPSELGELALSRQNGPPRRTPDLVSSRERVELVIALARELAIIKYEIKSYCTVESLKQKYPDFKLWTHIEKSQIAELVNGEEFFPKAYAEHLALAKYGNTSRETLRKDRRKLRKAKVSPPF